MTNLSADSERDRLENQLMESSAFHAALTYDYDLLETIIRVCTPGSHLDEGLAASVASLKTKQINLKIKLNDASGAIKVIKEQLKRIDDQGPPLLG